MSRPGSRWAIWGAAAKPASWPKLMVPCALGLGIGLAGGDSAEPGRCLAGAACALGFTVFDLLFIVFLNDWADREVDATKRRMFPRSSPKTIPDGRLSAGAVLAAGALCGAGALACAGAAWLLLERPWALPLAAASLGVFVAYSLPPLRLNYRGGGELLEALGVGALLPILSAHFVRGDLSGASGLWLLPGFIAASLGSAVASGLSDERSDRVAGKTTFVSVFGNLEGRRATERAMMVGAVGIAALGLLGGVSAAIHLPSALWLGHAARRARREGGAALTDAFDEQRRYKAVVHRGIWGAGAWIAAASVAWWLAYGAALHRL